jgi:uncharacterized YccA/Bax inhibitor family protein
MANPAFSQSPAFSENGRKAVAVPPVPPAPSASELDAQFAIPAATADQMGRMTYQDTIVKTVVSFAILVAGAGIGWVFPVLGIPGAIAGFVLALVLIFRKKPSAPLTLAYSAAEGLFVGAISMWFTLAFDSAIVPTAVFGTLGVVGITLALFASGKVRASKRATQIFLVAMLGYLVFSLVNVVLMMTGVANSMFGVRDMLIPGTNIPLGVPLGILVVLLAAYSLVIDFEQVKTGVQRGAPRAYGWTAAFGIMLTVVWLYLEILRLLSYFMPRS